MKAQTAKYCVQLAARNARNSKLVQIGVSAALRAPKTLQQPLKRDRARAHVESMQKQDPLSGFMREPHRAGYPVGTSVRENYIPNTTSAHLPLCPSLPPQLQHTGRCNPASMLIDGGQFAEETLALLGNPQLTHLVPPARCKVRLKQEMSQQFIVSMVPAHCQDNLVICLAHHKKTHAI